LVDKKAQDICIKRIPVKKSILKLVKNPLPQILLTTQASKGIMKRGQKNLSILLIAILTLSGIASFSNLALAEKTYLGTRMSPYVMDDYMELRLSQPTNSVMYLADQNSITFSTFFVKPYGGFKYFINSIYYKASWLSEKVSLYNWSYHDPANLSDDDPAPITSFQGTINLTDVPLGNQWIAVSALGGFYWNVNSSTYYIYTTGDGETLNLTFADYPTKTPQPTFSSESNIKWRTDVVWNLTGTPAQSLWKSDIERQARGWTNPVISNGVLYAGAVSVVEEDWYYFPQIKWVNIYAFDTQSGMQKWDYQAVFGSTTGLAVSDGRVYFGGKTDFDYIQERGNATESVNALDAATGKLLWSTPCAISSKPVADNGKVFINSGDSVLALDGATGKVLWKYATKSGFVSAPAIANGVLYVSSYDKTLYAVSTVDGSGIWSIKSDNGFSGCLVVNGVVYAGSGDGKMNAYQASTGTKLWSQNISPPEFDWVNRSRCLTPVYSSGALFFKGSSEQYFEQTGISGKTDIYALNVNSHNKKWNLTMNDFYFDNPIQVSNNIVYTVDIYNGTYGILGFNALNGALIWNFTQTDPYPGTLLTVADGTIYTAFSDGQLYAIRAPEIGFQIGNLDDVLFGDFNNILLLIIFVIIVVAVTVLVIYRSRKKRKIEAKSEGQSS
jgi:outer membrane protein assembly factor BamB